MPDSARTIENLLYAYAERIDDGDLEGVADLFTHGRIQATPDAGPEATFEGRDAVLGMYRAATRIHEDGTPRTKHLTTNVIVEVDDDAGTATCRSYYTVLQATGSLPLQPIITGRYHDTFHRLAGLWWFDTRIMLIDQVGELGHHLLYDLP